MGAVTGFHRLPILAIAALLAAGCGATPRNLSSPSAAAAIASASAVPTTAAPSSSPQPTTASPSSAPEPTVEPVGQDCPSTTSDHGLATLGDQADLYLPLEIEAVAPIAGGEPSAIARPREPGQASFFVGGRATRVQPSYDTNEPRDLVMSELRGRLVMDDGTRHDLDVRFEAAEDGANVAVVSIPNIEGRGTIRISLAWRDSCYEVSARTSNRVIIDRPSAIAGCAEGRNRGFDELGATFEPAIQVGPLDARLIPWWFAGKVAPLWVIDALPPYVAFNRDTPTLTASPGTSIPVTSTNAALELWVRDGAEVIAFRRAPLIRWLEDGWIHGNEPDAEIVFRSPLVANDDGTFSFAVPTEPGRYGLEAVFEYDAECSYGTAGFVVGVDVE